MLFWYLPISNSSKISESLRFRYTDKLEYRVEFFIGNIICFFCKFLFGKPHECIQMQNIVWKISQSIDKLLMGDEFALNDSQ